LGHELVDERIERLDAVFGGAAVEDLRAPGVPRPLSVNVV
jgi:hypothetical protein